MNPRPLDHPRRVGPHVAATLDMLHAMQIRHVEVYRTKHVRIEFDVGGFHFTIHTSCTPRDSDVEFRRIRQEVTKRAAEVHQALGYGGAR